MSETNLLRLGLFGLFRAAGADKGEIAGLSRRAQAMLAYLACQPGMRAERGLVADLLWSDRSEDQARASLRQELSVMRRVLPEGVIGASRQHVWLNENSVVLDQGEGAFLQGFDLASEGFEDWLRSERASSEARPEATAAPDPPPLGNRNRPGLVVLPFEELGVPDSDMFADGVVEEITGALSRVRDFHVIARQSAFALRGEQLDIPDIAARLGVDYIVEGSVRRSGERVRITVQLISGGDGRTLWSERFDDRLGDLFDLQDRIAARVSGQISPNLRAAEIARAGHLQPEEQTAYSLTLRALPHFWAQTRDGNARAIALLEQASARSPDYMPALGYLAWCLALNPTFLWSDRPEQDRRRAAEYSHRAARTGTKHAPTLVAIGAAIGLATEDAESSKGYLEEALRIDPNNAWAHLRMGWQSTSTHDYDIARVHFHQAELLSPLDPFRFAMKLGQAVCERETGNPRLASDLARKALVAAQGLSAPQRLLAAWCIEPDRDAAVLLWIRNLLVEHPDLSAGHLRASLPPGLLRWKHETIENGIVRAGLPEG